MISKFNLKPNSPAFVALAGLAAFSAYFSMYAFRKPITVATFENTPTLFGDIDYKIALITIQVLGYALSKWIGVRVVSSHSAAHRAWLILGLMSISWLALLGFALLPAPWNLSMVFINSLPLGMIWGFVFAWVEGRRTTELLSGILCASFIFASGAVKSVGAWLMHTHNVSEQWMPFATGAIFEIPLLISVALLACLPAPSEADIHERRARVSMDAAARKQSFIALAPTLAVLIFSYILLTAFRDIRESFAAEIWADLGYQNTISAFTISELPIAIGILCLLSLLSLVRSNKRANTIINILIVTGFFIIGISTWAFENNLISPMAWMTLSGAGLYLAYIPFGTVLFDRMIAMTGAAGNAGFLVYIADAFGYSTGVIVLLIRQFAMPDINWANFFIAQAYFTAFFGICFCLLPFLKTKHSDYLPSKSEI
ncbi:DUF5690 family protein [Hirschia litorea]|uniref:DUF5690 family protein n=1 Tax=Hirschia litorea TaxID=1199156 RepID=A0ABW2IKU6_9PROT